MKSVEPINPFCWILLLPIKIYQFTLGAIMPRVCRFQPTCSFYAYEAISVHGIFKGGWLAFKRILKCNPLNPGGFDPVPPRLEGN